MTILAVFPAAAFCLGSWQVYRLQWKLDLIERTNAALAKDPVALDPDTLLAPSAASNAHQQHTKVAIDGRVDPSVEFRVAPRVRDGEPGFYAVTPFVLSSGQRILLNRGWIARDKEADGARKDLARAETRVVGLVKRDNERPAWSHDNKPELGQWYWTDVTTMSKLASTQPVLVDAVDSEAKRRRDLGLPIPRPPVATFKNNHLEYAITWYSLCAATTAMLVLRRRRAAGGAAAGMARFGRARMV
ncbi:SURF1 family-domain-containing protein [Catenaria anguillulae PL171]|uniref:SURF1-like protein n=1 Tax=Catenaria anguillulae PL171 TaxID=765915 RepID=A0A1Y2HML8_9FUNG|nr:SURF1 family-domain-containing protein [Catenaria anguillulae PL171]